MVSKTKQNYIFQVIYGILSMIVPLITAPYVTRVLGADNLGIYNYAYSISGIFLKISELGVVNHGSRSIASYQKDIESRSQIFWEIYFIQFCVSLIITGVYFFYVLSFVKEHYLIALLQVIYVSSSIFNIRWFYMGLEQFKKTVTRDLIVKILSFIALFVFVKSRADLWKYTVITLSAFTASNIFLWYGIKKYIKWVKPSKQGILDQIKPMLVLFIPTIAVSIYTVMDKVMLGAISGETSVAYYHYASVIAAIPLFFITSFGQVMLPRLSAMAAEGDTNSNSVIDKSLLFAFFMACAFSFGLSAISSEFIPLYYGEEFNDCTILLILISFKLPFMAYSDVIRSQVLIPHHEDRKFVISLFFGAGINLLSNSLLIPGYGAVGAAIGTIVSEAAVSISQLFLARKRYNPIKSLKSSLSFVLIGLIMFFVVVAIKNSILCKPIFKLIIEIASGAFCYLSLSFVYAFFFMDRKGLQITLKSMRRGK